MQKLVFERENQAVLSSDELRVLHRWWDELSPTLKQRLINKTASVRVSGYTSTTGTDYYNHELGKARADEVGSRLPTGCDESIVEKSVS